MEIKPGDIVEYQGRHVRVMDMTNTPSGFREQLLLSHFESIPEPTIKNHDIVIIKDIPKGEKTHYGVGWGFGMNKLTSSGDAYEITNIHYSYRFGWIGCIEGYTFQLYHIVPANHFDMI